MRIPYLLFIFLLTVSCTSMKPSTTRTPAATPAEELEQARIRGLLRDFIDGPRLDVEAVSKAFLDLKTAHATCERFSKASDWQPDVSMEMLPIDKIFKKDPSASLWSDVNGVNCPREKPSISCIMKFNNGNFFISMYDDRGRTRFYVCGQQRLS